MFKQPSRIALSLVLSTAILLGAVSQMACNPKLIPAARVAVAAIGPFIDRQVAAGKISPELAEALRVDLGEGIDAFELFQAEFKAASDKAGQAQAAIKLEHRWCEIYNRGNFGKSKAINDVVDVADLIIATIAAFYAPGTFATLPLQAKSNNGVPREQIPVPQTKDEFERVLKARIDALNRATAAP